MEIKELTISKIREGLSKKEFSAVELARSFLEKIEKEDKKISSYLSVLPELALSQAEKIDGMIYQKKELPLLAGVPCAIKDNMMLRGEKCTAASKILENYYAPYSATVVKKLEKEGAVFLGKTNLDEFAMGSSTENSAFKITKNPHDITRVPGGSSGGSAAAVAADMAVFSLGSDTGGSIRLPASFCGVAGLKPTYGAVSRYGLIAFASSLDQIGPFAKTIEDVETVFKVISGKDPMDSTSVPFQYNQSKINIKGMKIGVPKEYFVEGMEKEVEEAVKSTIKKYEEMGAEIKEVSLPNTKYALPAYYIISPSEASANLARFDGIRYGFSTKDADSLLEVYSKSKGEGFGPEVRRRIMIGTYALSSGYYDAYYLKAQKVRTLVKKDFEKAFEKVDILMTPASPTLPFKIGEKTEDPLSMYLSDIYTVSINLAGLPAIVIPVGESKGLPIGLQIIGKPFEENIILQTAKIYG
jgi:aspartyl-tRNA(Asn)/glutamyl-tRNA(Gln) amidotransferase subunit A